MLSSGGRAFSARGSRRGQSLLLTWLQSDCLQLRPSGTQAAALRVDLHVSTPAASLSTGADEKGGRKPRGWVPGWLKERLPKTLQPADEYPPEEMTLDKYAQVLAAGRQIGKVAGGFTSAAQATPEQAANMAVSENIIRAMSAEDKRNIASFGSARRRIVAEEVGCDVSKVDECIGKFLWMSKMLQEVQAKKKAGQALPQDMDEISKTVGASWHTFRDAVSSGSLAQDSSSSRLPSNQQAAPAPTSVVVPQGAISGSGQPCPLAGQLIGRRTTCPLTQKKYKACCGRGSSAGITLKR